MYKTKSTTAQVVDPVCGAAIDARSDITYAHEGRVYQFCCLSCRSRFRLNPSLFAGRHTPRTGPGLPEAPGRK
ncbi:MAG: YHS domain-containing protein [Acidiferrobacteraceae bacterium]